jgi:diguanylate cyclase (GGDEF)-like protein
LNPLPRATIKLLIAAVVIGASVWFSAQIQRDAAERAFAETETAEQLLISMLDQQTGVRGFTLSGDERFLRPYVSGRVDFERTLEHAQTGDLAGGDDGTAGLLAAQVASARRWQELARGQIRTTRLEGPEAVSTAALLNRNLVFDRFRTENERFQALLQDRRSELLNRADLIAIGLTLLITGGFGLAGLFAVRSRSRAERRQRDRERRDHARQGEFVEAIQLMRNEDDAAALVKRYIEGDESGRQVAVLRRTLDAASLDAGSTVDEASPFAARLAGSDPDACLAMRFGRTHVEDASRSALIRCELCGEDGGASACIPSLVGGEVQGAVLIRDRREIFPEAGIERAEQSVAQAGPVILNLRNLESANRLATTDALSGLPNHRSCTDTLHRMAAQAARSLEPLACVLMDIDRFKRINDNYGHAAGDRVIEAIGRTLPRALRTSDFAGRYGGEEFLLLLPGTDTAGAMVAAEKVREGLREIDVPELEGHVHASFGVSVYPEDAVDVELLLRSADRALYAAKANGRNRVELARALDQRAAD